MIRFIFVTLITLLISVIAQSAALSCGDLWSESQSKQVQTLAPLIDRQIISSAALIDSLWDESQVLALGNPDHENLTIFKNLEDFLQRHVTDTDFKVLVLEISHDFYQVFQDFSLGKIGIDDPDLKRYSGNSIQDLYIYENILPLIQKINAQRKGDPLMIVAIDSLSANNWSESILLKGETPVIKVQQKEVPQNSAEIWAFANSLDREIQTARNFEHDVLNHYPNKKTLVVYQNAHVMKNLKAVGATRESGVPTLKWAPLSWASQVAQKSEQFRRRYHVVTFDERGSWNQQGVLTEDMGFLNSATGTRDQAFSTQSPLQSAQGSIFVPQSFLAGYRGGSLRIVSKNSVVVDGVVATSKIGQAKAKPIR